MRILEKLRQRGANIPDARDTKTVAIDFRLRPDGAPADTLSPHLEIDRGSRFSSLGASVIFDFVGVFANDNTRQQNRQGEKTANGCKITINLHFSPHSMNIRDRKPGKA